MSTHPGLPQPGFGHDPVTDAKARFEAAMVDKPKNGSLKDPETVPEEEVLEVVTDEPVANEAAERLEGELARRTLRSTEPG